MCGETVWLQKKRESSEKHVGGPRNISRIQITAVGKNGIVTEDSEADALMRLGTSWSGENLVVRLSFEPLPAITVALVPWRKCQSKPIRKPIMFASDAGSLVGIHTHGR